MNTTVYTIGKWLGSAVMLACVAVLAAPYVGTSKAEAATYELPRLGNVYYTRCYQNDIELLKAGGGVFRIKNNSPICSQFSGGTGTSGSISPGWSAHSDIVVLDTKVDSEICVGETNYYLGGYPNRWNVRRPEFSSCNDSPRCDGYTLEEYVCSGVGFNRSCSWQTIETNSAQCGYYEEPDPYCDGFDYWYPYHNNGNGTWQWTFQSNSEQCGYVPPPEPEINVTIASVNNPHPLGDSGTGRHARIYSGGSVLISWTGSNVTNCRLTGSGQHSGLIYNELVPSTGNLELVLNFEAFYEEIYQWPGGWNTFYREKDYTNFSVSCDASSGDGIVNKGVSADVYGDEEPAETCTCRGEEVADGETCTFYDINEGQCSTHQADLTCDDGDWRHTTGQFVGQLQGTYVYESCAVPEPDMSLSVRNERTNETVAGVRIGEAVLTIEEGDDVGIYWNADNADSCVEPLTASERQLLNTRAGRIVASEFGTLSTVQLDASMLPEPGERRTYTYACRGFDGLGSQPFMASALLALEDEETLSVTVETAASYEVPELSANPIRVSSNDTSTLTYDIKNNTSCTISGPVYPDGVTVTSNGSLETGPITAQSTFTLTCDGGEDTATVSIQPNLEEQ